jgi:hypothetical protein
MNVIPFPGAKQGKPTNENFTVNQFLQKIEVGSHVALRPSLSITAYKFSDSPSINKRILELLPKSFKVSRIVDIECGKVRQNESWSEAERKEILPCLILKYAGYDSVMKSNLEKNNLVQNLNLQDGEIAILAKDVVVQK